MSFVSGTYDWQYNGVSLGVLATPPRLRFSFSAEEVRGDNMGDTIQALINRGGSLYMDLVFEEWDNAAVQAVIWPFAGAADFGHMGSPLRAIPSYPSIGCPLVAQTLAAIAASGSCATPAYWGFQALLAPGQDVTWAMGSTLRMVPVSMLVFPQTLPIAVPGSPVGQEGYTRYWTNTAPA